MTQEKLDNGHLQRYRVDKLEENQQSILEKLDAFPSMLDEVVRRIKDDKIDLERRLTRLEERQKVVWGAIVGAGTSHIPSGILLANWLGGSSG